METEGGAKTCLDLTVTRYTINKGRNQELLGRSAHLAGYVEFVARARENEKTMPRDEAITEAVRQCIRQGILADFLEEHGSGGIKKPASPRRPLVFPQGEYALYDAPLSFCISPTNSSTFSKWRYTEAKRI
jgi:hypothetical protein